MGGFFSFSILTEFLTALESYDVSPKAYEYEDKQRDSSCQQLF